MVRRGGGHMCSGLFPTDANKLSLTIFVVHSWQKHGVGLRAREQFTLYEIHPAWNVDDEFGI